jgi:hypothetical protein
LQRLIQKLQHARLLLATDVDETLTHKNADGLVHLNAGVLAYLGSDLDELPYPPLPNQGIETQLLVFTTGRTLQVALNWLPELGQAINDVQAPDVLVCNNGMDAYYNNVEAETWGEFMHALHHHADAMQFNFYSEALLEHYTHDETDVSRIPLGSLVRSRLIAHFFTFFSQPLEVVSRGVGLDLLGIELFSDAHNSHALQGFAQLIKVMRQQFKMEVTHGIHLPVRVDIQGQTYIEHLIVAFFGEGDPKPLIQSMGCQPYTPHTAWQWQETLRQDWCHATASPSISTLIPLNLRSIPLNHTQDALSLLIQALAEEARHAFVDYFESGIEIHISTQSKQLDSPIARQESNSPRAYILVEGLLDKGISLSYVYDAFIMLAKEAGFSAFDKQLETCLTLGDGKVDETLLANPALNALHHATAVAIPNFPTVVHNTGCLETPEANGLWRAVVQRNPNALYATCFQPNMSQMVLPAMKKAVDS